MFTVISIEMVVASAFVIWIQRKASSSIETGILSACVNYGLAKFTYGRNENDVKLALSNNHLVWNRYPNGKLILFSLKVWGTFPYSVEISTINGEK